MVPDVYKVNAFVGQPYHKNDSTSSSYISKWISVTCFFINFLVPDKQHLENVKNITSY